MINPKTALKGFSLKSGQGLGPRIGTFPVRKINKRINPVPTIQIPVNRIIFNGKIFSGRKNTKNEIK